MLYLRGRQPLLGLPATTKSNRTVILTWTFSLWILCFLLIALAGTELWQTPTHSRYTLLRTSNVVQNFQQPITSSALASPAIVKVSKQCIVQDLLAEAALQTHVEHNRRWNYGFEVLRQEMGSQIWSKLYFLSGLLSRELARSPSRRARWLMWIDTEVFLVNPSLPLEIFLPPEDMSDIHLIVTKDHNGLTTSIFFIRVDLWSARLMTKLLGSSPDENSDVRDQDLLTTLLQDETIAQHTLFQPRLWHNAYQTHHGFEGGHGSLLVHFPGLEDHRDPHMKSWLDVINGPQRRRWDVHLNATDYSSEVPRFWTAVRSARVALQRALDSFGDLEQMPDIVRNPFSDLKTLLHTAADEPHRLSHATDELCRALV